MKTKNLSFGDQMTIPTLCEKAIELDKLATKEPWDAEIWMNFDEGGFAAVGPHHQPGDTDEERYDNTEPESPCGNQAKLDANFIAFSRTALPTLAREVQRLTKLVEDARYHLEMIKDATAGGKPGEFPHDESDDGYHENAFTLAEAALTNLNAAPEKETK